MDIFSLCFYTFQYSHSFPNLFPIKGKVTAEKCFLYIEKKILFFILVLTQEVPQQWFLGYFQLQYLFLQRSTVKQ